MVEQEISTQRLLGSNPCLDTLRIRIKHSLFNHGQVNYGLQTNISSDLMAIDIREALYHFGMITGQVTNDELLGNIFANFCIGK